MYTQLFWKFLIVFIEAVSHNAFFYCNYKQIESNTYNTVQQWVKHDP